MDLVLAIDLKGGLVVHGKRGERGAYRPLTWGLSPTAEPVPFLEHIRPALLYIADLDRIMGVGYHDREIRDCARMVQRCYVDRGCRAPEDQLSGENIVNIIGTETAGSDLSRYTSGILSLDIRDGRVIPGDQDPIVILREAAELPFEGCLVLDLGAVGTEGGLSAERLAGYRAAYQGYLLFGGGVAGEHDLDLLASEGFDGAIVATAVHRGLISLDAVRRGSWS
ncbi:MAG: nickel transporter [Methanomicrobiales archaeon]|nr:nickel transporter [Methanomicrobiales archaeon]